MSIQSYSANELAYQALRDLGALRAGQGPSSDVLTDCFVAVNQLIDSWLIDQLLVYAYVPNQYTLNGTSITYTIGPSGADFTAPRPTGIQDANIILNNTSPVVRQPVSIINVDQWASIRVQNLQPAIPLVLYYDANFNPTLGYGSINLWPGPQASYILEIYTWQQLTAFADQTTPIKFPPAYAQALRKSLAVAIAPMMLLYGKENGIVGSAIDKALPLVQQQARLAMAALRSYNAKTPVLGLDPAYDGVGNRDGFNWMTGNAGRGW
jgi:hypothetical protein